MYNFHNIEGLPLLKSSLQELFHKDRSDWKLHLDIFSFSLCLSPV